jgi:RND family efflux transporter MFP subunit
MHPSQSRAQPRAAFVLGMAAVLLTACGSSDAPPGDAAAREAVMTVTATPLTRVELTRTVSMTGSVFAWQDVIIASEVGGYRVAEVFVDVGDRVTKGQRLVAMSKALLEAEVATKQAVLSQRQAELTNAQAAFERAKSLMNMNVLSQADLDRLTSEELASRARLESARADLETSQLRLRFTDVTAPDDGVITSRTVTVGQIAQAGNEMLRLLRNGRIEWRGEAPETRLADLAPGQPVSITTADGTKYLGSIRIVSPTIAAGNRTALVYVDLAPNDALRPGMFARGEIEIGTGPAFTVPLESIVSADGYSYVFVIGSNNTVARRRIETGAVQGDSIEVVSGIEGGETVVIKGAGFLKDGDLVNVGNATSGS